MTKSTWQLFDLVLRNALVSVWQWPLLTVVTILAATLAWGLYLEEARFATAVEVASVNVLIFYALHAAIFAPLMVWETRPSTSICGTGISGWRCQRLCSCCWFFGWRGTCF
jgi:hypothetical protein